MPILHGAPERASDVTRGRGDGPMPTSSIVEVEDPLRAPLNSELSHHVEALLRGGERRVLLDLARLDDIDAAGVGELIRAFKMTDAAGGVLQIAHASSRVRRILRLTGVLGVLTADA
jgi:anti-anti-sigma factor